MRKFVLGVIIVVGSLFLFAVVVPLIEGFLFAWVVPKNLVWVGPRIGPDSDLDEIEITADSPLWWQNPTAASWLVLAQTEKMQAFFARQHGDIAEAQKHEALAKQDQELARAALRKHH